MKGHQIDKDITPTFTHFTVTEQSSSSILFTLLNTKPIQMFGK